jgi:hypothetical protein
MIYIVCIITVIVMIYYAGDDDPYQKQDREREV